MHPLTITVFTVVKPCTKIIGLGIIRHTYQLYPQRMKEIRLEHNKAEQEDNLRNKLSVLKLGKF